MVEGQEAGGCVASITVTAHHTSSQVPKNSALNSLATLQIYFDQLSVL
jgi:hypothetical protein